ncbi:MAG TPA: XdhC/CoxI family protein [Anaerolineae bacterium]|nr:XdhC/CoxI family protein [Anaerolineae bacterium]HQJ52036.1 XdhC/CoxI family protein [Anaerolineae bacterium]
MDEKELVYEAVLAAIRSGEPGCLLTLIEVRGSTPREVGTKMLLRADGSTVGTIGGGPMEAAALLEARQALTEGTSRTSYYSLEGTSSTDLGVCGGDARVFIEVLRPKPTLLIAGAGHVGQPMALFGQQLGFRVVVADDRAEFANAERFPGADQLIVGPYEELRRRVEPGPRTYIVIATRGHEFDELVLHEFVDCPAAYIGMIGSKRKVRTVFDSLLARGVSQASLARVYAPIGLRTGGQTPAEIALSILAEIIAVQHGGTGEPMCRKDNPAASAE